jgi:hypothetical protein
LLVLVKNTQKKSKGGYMQQGVGSVHATLTEDTFQSKYLQGYAPVVPADLLEARGGQVRYAIDTVDAAGNVVSTAFRLGGTLTFVDSQLRYVRLLNPTARRGWSVQLERPRGERLRLWYMPPGTRDEIIMFRKLLQQLENNEIEIRRLK